MFDEDLYLLYIQSQQEAVLQYREKALGDSIQEYEQFLIKKSEEIFQQVKLTNSENSN